MRFVQVTHSDANVQWDQHGNLKKGHAKNAREVDRPIAGLLQGPEGPRACWRTRSSLGRRVRPHARPPRATTAATTTPRASPCGWPAAASRRGFRYGATDDYGYYAVENKVHIHDLHATILHLLGLDHERLTYRYAGRDFRLTDVAGQVVREIIA